MSFTEEPTEYLTRIADTLERIEKILDRPQVDFDLLDTRLKVHEARLQSVERLLRNDNFL